MFVVVAAVLAGKVMRRREARYPKELEFLVVFKKLMALALESKKALLF